MSTVMFFDPRPTLANDQRSVDFGWELIKFVSGVFSSLFNSIQTSVIRRETEQTLSSLDDKVLRDIGVDRYLISQIARQITSQSSAYDSLSDRGRLTQFRA